MSCAVLGTCFLWCCFDHQDSQCSSLSHRPFFLLLKMYVTQKWDLVFEKRKWTGIVSSRNEIAYIGAWKKEMDRQYLRRLCWHGYNDHWSNAMDSKQITVMYHRCHTHTSVQCNEVSRAMRRQHASTSPSAISQVIKLRKWLGIEDIVKVVQRSRFLWYMDTGHVLSK